MTPGASSDMKSLLMRKYLHIILPLFLASVISYLDRVNVAYAALTMNRYMGFSAKVFGMGAGIFFVGYILFEVPGALIAEKYSAMKSIKTYRKPLLSIHSVADPTVPFDLGKKLFDNANEPKTFFAMNKICHLCGPVYYSEEISQKIKNMLNK